MKDETRKKIDVESLHWAQKHSKAPDQSPDWIMADFSAGAEFGYQLAMEEHGEEETLRDKIAVQVLPEIIREQGQLKNKYVGCENILYENCTLAYKIADAMMNVRIGKSFYDRK